MAEDDGAERSHEPTSRRREQARQEGRVLTSKEVAVCASIAAGTTALQGLTTLAPMAATRWALHLQVATTDGFEAVAGRALADAALAVLAVGLAVALPVAVAAVAAQAMLSGLQWTPGNLSFKGNRIDPMAGMGRMFSARSLVELGKALAKIVLLGAVVAMVAKGALPRLPDLQDMSRTSAVATLADLVLHLFWSLILVLAAVAAFDLFWQMRQLSQSLRMTLDEVRRESREDNGSPELKARQRRVQHDMARRGAKERAALANVPTATSIITNPQHFAVAIRYVAGETPAPVIVARGTDAMAARIIEAGRRSGVPILPLPPLARALYFTGDIGQPIADGLFTAVAAVLAHLWRVERGIRDDLPDVALPRDLQFNAQGRRGE